MTPSTTSVHESVVALLAEGVDRNLPRLRQHRQKSVALLAEGVDRNCIQLVFEFVRLVALLAEGVDRNRPLIPPPE